MSSVPILLYHHVAPDREITPEGFERQMSWLKDSGWRTLSVAELCAHLSGERPAPERSAAVTFDDGYADNWVYAYPILRLLGLTACVFVVTGRVGDAAARPTAEQGGSLTDTATGERDPEGFLSWPELAAMSRSGVVEVGSHTHSHRDFVREKAYGDLEDELRQSRQAIESKVGAWNGALAWPWGDFEESWLPKLAPAGYRAAFTTRVGSNPPGRSPWLIRRFKVRSGEVAWLDRRLWLYQKPLLAEAYGRLHGLDRAVKNCLGA